MTVTIPMVAPVLRGRERLEGGEERKQRCHGRKWGGGLKRVRNSREKGAGRKKDGEQWEEGLRPMVGEWWGVDWKPGVSTMEERRRGRKNLWVEIGALVPRQP